MSRIRLSILAALCVLPVFLSCKDNRQNVEVVLHQDREPVQAGEFGYNPICPMGVYMADPSAKVLDGRLYVACSLDENLDLPVEKRVNDLLKRMSVEDKVNQISAQLLFMDEIFDQRDYSVGHIRNVGHFLPDGGFPNNPAGCMSPVGWRLNN